MIQLTNYPGKMVYVKKYLSSIENNLCRVILTYLTLFLMLKFVDMYSASPLQQRKDN